MGRKRYVNAGATRRVMTDAFLGYQHTLKNPEGAWYDMENLTGEEYPLLATRKTRAVFLAPTAGQSARYQGLIAKDALTFVEGSTLYYNGYPTGLNDLSVPTITRSETEPGLPAQGEYWYDPATGVTMQYRSGIWVEASYPRKQLVSMGATLCVFPDKKYLNTADLTDYGSMENSVTVTGAVTYSPAAADGSDISPEVGATPPASPANGDYWIDTGGETDMLRRWSSIDGVWADIAATYVKISGPLISSGFSRYDGVEISGSALEELNGAKVIEALGEGYIIVTGLTRGTVTQSGTITVKRTVPDLDYVCEVGNRLWGCFYGMKNGEAVNELYACALGDFKNWQKFQGLSTDSWAAGCGSDGEWTGAVNYFGSPVFFKEEHIHMIAISATGAHQVTDYVAEGVQKGSWASLAVVGSTLYYKSRLHVCAFEGGMPAVISRDLGAVSYREAAAGGWADKLYLSMRSADGWSLFVYDTHRQWWHREDSVHGLAFAPAEDDLYCLTPEGILALRGTQGTPEDGTALQWSAETGILCTELPDQKYVSRYDLRLRSLAGGSLTVWLEYDSSGNWEEQETVSFSGTGSVALPIRPRRCDHLRLRLTGTGEMRLFSIARVLEKGSDYTRFGSVTEP